MSDNEAKANHFYGDDCPGGHQDQLERAAKEVREISEDNAKAKALRGKYTSKTGTIVEAIQYGDPGWNEFVDARQFIHEVVIYAGGWLLDLSKAIGRPSVIVLMDDEFQALFEPAGG